MIATYIQELLASNNRVIIPNYGAFLVRATSKSKDADTLEEKLKDIYFSPFLKFNDELLEKYIIKKENVTKEEAADKIKDFIDKIKKELEQNKPFIIQDFGQFSADKQGKVQFETFAKVKQSPATDDQEETPKTTTKKPAAKKTTVKETKTEEVKAEEKAAAPLKETTEKKEEKQEPVVASKETKKESKLEEYKPEQKQAASTSQKPVYSYKKEKKPVNKGLIWSIAIGLPLAAIFIWALLNFDTVKKVFDKDQVKTEKVVQKKKAPVKKTDDSKLAENKTEAQKETTQQKANEETKAKAAAETEKNPAEIQKAAPNQKKYYIIAGSFQNEKYAISYLNKLKAEGYNAEKLAERNGMHAVSYSSFVDKRKALAEYRFLTQEKKLQTWILYY